MAAKRQLEYSRAAGDDLESIQRYIEVDNPKAAARVLESILDAADGLIDFPMTGRYAKTGVVQVPILDYLSADPIKRDRFGCCTSIAQTPWPQQVTHGQCPSK